MIQRTLPNLNKNTFTFNVIRGLLVLTPVLAFIYLFRELFLQIKGWVKQIIDTTPIDSFSQLVVVLIVSIAILTLVAYLVGVLTRTKFAENIAMKLDEVLLGSSSVYRKLKLDADNKLQFILDDNPMVFVQFGHAERPGFLMEKVEKEGKCVVFIPKDFSTFNGNVYVVLLENVRYAKGDKMDILHSIDLLGTGMDIS